MSARDSLPGGRRPVNYAAWSFALAFVTLGGGIIAQWSAGAERARQSEARDIEQNARIAATDARVRDIENNRAIERQIADMQVALTQRLAAVETALKAVQEGSRRR